MKLAQIGLVKPIRSLICSLFDPNSHEELIKSDIMSSWSWFEHYVKLLFAPLCNIVDQSDHWRYYIAIQRIGGYRKSRHECSFGVYVVIDYILLYGWWWGRGGTVQVFSFYVT